MSSTANVEQRTRAVEQLRRVLALAPLRLDTGGTERARHEISRLIAGVGARRRARAARSRIEVAIDEVAGELVVAPVEAEVAELRRLDALLHIAGA